MIKHQYRMSDLHTIKDLTKEREHEIMNALNGCSKVDYHKSEVLPELLKLEKQVVEILFDEEHTEKAALHLLDVERHLIQLNETKEHIADLEVERFVQDSKEVSNLIRAEISGNYGESKAFQAIDRIQEKHILLKNVEFKDENSRTEIDGIVITANGVFIIEVKNTKRDIFIDEAGNYFRTGEYLRWDSCIGDKIAVKKQLLVKALSDAGIDVGNIFSIVVFTNNRIQVQNKCTSIHTCFLSQLPHFISESTGDVRYSEDMQRMIVSAIEAARNRENYPLHFDADKFKKDFAAAVIKLEDVDAEAKTEEKCIEVDQNCEAPENTTTHNSLKWIIAGVVCGAGITMILNAGRKKAS